MDKEPFAAERVDELRQNIDFSDIPEIKDFSGFYPRHPEYFKPMKEQVTIRLNKVLLAHFRAKGRGWQSEVNDFLMAAYMQGQI